MGGGPSKRRIAGWKAGHEGGTPVRVDQCDADADLSSDCPGSVGAHGGMTRPGQDRYTSFYLRCGYRSKLVMDR